MVMVQIDFEEFAAWMMSSSRLAMELRHKVDTKYGSLDNFVDDAEARMQGRANSKQFLWKSEEGGWPHTIFVLLEEPGSSTLAIIIGTYIQASCSMPLHACVSESCLIIALVYHLQLLIFVGSILFVAESLETIKVDKTWLTAFHVSFTDSCVFFCKSYIFLWLTHFANYADH